MINKHRYRMYAPLEIINELRMNNYSVISEYPGIYCRPELANYSIFLTDEEKDLLLSKYNNSITLKGLKNK